MHIYFSLVLLSFLFDLKLNFTLIIRAHIHLSTLLYGTVPYLSLF